MRGFRVSGYQLRIPIGAQRDDGLVTSTLGAHPFEPCSRSPLIPPTSTPSGPCCASNSPETTSTSSISRRAPACAPPRSTRRRRPWSASPRRAPGRGRRRLVLTPERPRLRGARGRRQASRRVDPAYRRVRGAARGARRAPLSATTPAPGRPLRLVGRRLGSTKGQLRAGRADGAAVAAPGRPPRRLSAPGAKREGVDLGHVRPERDNGDTAHDARPGAPFAPTGEVAGGLTHRRPPWARRGRRRRARSDSTALGTSAGCGHGRAGAPPAPRDPRASYGPERGAVRVDGERWPGGPGGADAHPQLTRWSCVGVEGDDRLGEATEPRGRGLAQMDGTVWVMGRCASRIGVRVMVREGQGAVPRRATRRLRIVAPLGRLRTAQEERFHTFPVGNLQIRPNGFSLGRVLGALADCAQRCARQRGTTGSGAREPVGWGVWPTRRRRAPVGWGWIASLWVGR